MITNNSITTCPVCNSRLLYYSFTLAQHRIVQCNQCRLMLINPQPSDETLKNIYGSDYFIFSDENEGVQHVQNLKKSTASRYLDLLIPNSVDAGTSLLEIGCGGGDFLEVAARRGLKVTGVEYSPDACANARVKLKEFDAKVLQGEINVLFGSKEQFDYIVFCNVLDHVRDPRLFLKLVFELLKPDGKVFCVVPSLDSWSARCQKIKWMEFKLDHLTYFDTKNLRSLLFQENFSEIKHFPTNNILLIDYIENRFFKLSAKRWSQLVSLGAALLPKQLLKRPYQITASGIGMIAKKQSKAGNLSLSVIMPAFNEVNTIQNGINKVLAKQIDGIDIELILVESNSNDGTKEIVKKYIDYPRVKVILEEQARGKGHAVRAGLKRASSDFILIQDADDEYDIDDYDALLEPLRDGREAFILGARHGGGALKMRTFSDQPVRAFILNFGHWVFATLINTLYGVWLRDPFTMYKVFRRDCLEGIVFECDRFDFDCELLIKLIRKGFKPLEIPVNYRSRSFLEGKKVRMFADPITWLRAIIKFRFVKV